MSTLYCVVGHNDSLGDLPRFEADFSRAMTDGFTYGGMQRFNKYQPIQIRVSCGARSNM
jgi:hypothetical protein